MNKANYHNCLIDLWKKSKLLDKIPEDRRGESVHLMENQRIMDGISTDDVFNRLSVPIVSNFMAHFLAFNIGSVQTMSGPEDKYFVYERNKLVEKPCAAQNHRLKAVWPVEALQDLPKKVNGIDVETELMIILGQEIAFELTRQLLNKIREKAATVGCINVEKCDDLVSSIFEFSKNVGEVCKRGNPNWMITSPEVIEKLKITDEMGYFYVGTSLAGHITDGEQEIKVYRDPLFPAHQIIMGFKGEEPYNAGCVFCPYILMQKMGLTLDPDSFAPRVPLMSRFFFEITDPRCFGRLSLANF